MPPDDRDIELALLRLAWRLDALDQWREQTDRHMSANTERLDNLSTSEKIAEAVSQRINAERQLVLTFGQKLAAVLVGAVAVADAIRGLVG